MATALLVIAPTWAQRKAERHSVLMGAKNLTVTTTQNTVYYYLVSAESNPVIHLTDGQVRILNDEFSLSDIKSLRFRALPRFLLDEDSTTYDKAKSVEHGLLALRRSLNVGKWNSLVLPVNLTAEQIVDAFGEGTVVATPRGIRESDATVVEFQTVDLTPGEIVIKAGYHYLIRPTREPDLSAEAWSSSFLTGQRIYGPIYMIPNVSTTTTKTPRVLSYGSTDETVTVSFRGTFLKRDDSSNSNKRIDTGTYMLSDDGLMVKNAEPAEVKAFTSWVQDMSGEKVEQLRFYIDGVNEDISEFTDAILSLDKEQWTKDEAVYDLGGRYVGSAKNRASLKAGIYVINGQKVVIK